MGLSHFGLHFSFDMLDISRVITLKFQICAHKNVGKICQILIDMVFQDMHT